MDEETTLSSIPPEAWDYKLGNRSALEWVLDQYKEKKPSDPLALRLRLCKKDIFKQLLRKKGCRISFKHLSGLYG